MLREAGEPDRSKRHAKRHAILLPVTVTVKETDRARVGTYKFSLYRTLKTEPPLPSPTYLPTYSQIRGCNGRHVIQLPPTYPTNRNLPKLTTSKGHQRCFLTFLR